MNGLFKRMTVVTVAADCYGSRAVHVRCFAMIGSRRVALGVVRLMHASSKNYKADSHFRNFGRLLRSAAPRHMGCGALQTRRGGRPGFLKHII